IPAPTARRYASLFKDFLSSKKMGRVTKYPESAVEIFKRIVSLYNDGMVTTEIEQQLRSEFPRTIEISPSERGVPAQPAMNIQAELSGAFAEMMDKMSNFCSSCPQPKKIKALPQLDIKSITEEYDERTIALEQKDVELESATNELAQENTTLKHKLEVMEAELIRLRKDRREMENYFMDKIKRLNG
ncbi:hypothetical protein ADUPG1_001911, partial [Aduncisulcus paluster]